MKDQENNEYICESLPDIFELIKEIEQQFPVDSIEFSDGTRLWNLIRVLLYFYPMKKDANNRGEKISSKSLFYLLKEGLSPLNVSNKKIEICGFSGTESRKFRDGKFYDIYMDPLYNVLGDNFYVFEWTTPKGYRRKYEGSIHSKNYVAMHIPLFSKTFFDLAMYKLLRKRKFSIEHEKALQDIITFFSERTATDKNDLTQNIYDSVAVFFHMKDFFIKLLHQISPKAVLIRCGYGRFHMALSQACRKLDIPSIEIQHGILTKYHAGYVKVTESENRDCVPEYILTYGDAFTDIIRKGSLFEKEKVVTVGFPYMEEVKKFHPIIDDKLNEFISKFTTTILVTSQWTVADEIKEFILGVAKELKNRNKDVGIVFKPHPRDWRNYSDMEKIENMFIASKYDDIYEMLKIVDIHSTVYSTSGLEALAFGKPNIFVDVGKTTIEEIINIIDNKTSFLVSSTQEYMAKMEYIISHYESLTKEAIKKSEVFFKPNANKNIETFLSSIGITIKND